MSMKDTPVFVFNVRQYVNVDINQIFSLWCVCMLHPCLHPLSEWKVNIVHVKKVTEMTATEFESFTAFWLATLQEWADDAAHLKSVPY